MATIQDLLDEVWSELRQASITDNVTMIEYIATLLTEEDPWPFPLERPQRPRIRYNISETTIKDRLLEASILAQGKQNLFDRYILFQSSYLREKDAYPTPRHIVDFLLSLIDVRPEHSFADFSCGSGGFLVHRYRNAPPDTIKGRTVGVEIAPDWARIAAANAALHGMGEPTTKIYIGNAFRVCGSKGPLAGQTFDRIAMDPPFRTAVEPSLITEAFPNEDVTSAWLASELLFTLLLYGKLAPQGQGAVLVPTQLLAQNAAIPSSIREILVREQPLKAVISLHQGTLSPFVEEEVSVLLIEKDRPRDERPTWFFSVEKDGYPRGRGRDLTAVQDLSPAENDLPFVLAVLQTTEDALHWENDQRLLATRYIEGQGLILKIGDVSTLLSLDLIQIADGPRQGNYLVADLLTSNYASTRRVLPLTTGGQNVTFLQQIQGERGERIFENGAPGQLLAITIDGRLLGVTQSEASVSARQYDLQSATYVPSREILQRLEPAALLLANTRRDQRFVARYVENLLGRLESKPIVGKQLPPKPYQYGPFPLLEYLGPTQRKIWQRIQQLDPTNTYAFYFTPEQLDADAATARETLGLLERLGLIVQVTITHPQTGHTISCYRRVTELDITTITDTH